MSDNTRLLVGLVACALAACQNDQTNLSNSALTTAAIGLPPLSDCVLKDLQTAMNGEQKRDPEFERTDRTKDWRFSLQGQMVRSQSRLRGSDAGTFEVPVVSQSADAVVGEGPTPIEMGRMRYRIEISRKPDAKGKHRVRQTRTWQLPAGTPGTLMPFHKWNTSIVDWTFECSAGK